LGVVRVSNNSFAVVFDVEPETLDPLAYDSGTNEQNYTLTAVDPSIVTGSGETWVPRGEVVPRRFPVSGVAEKDTLDPTQIIVTSDAAMEPGVRYTVEVSSLITGADGETFAGPTEFEFRAPGLPREARSPRVESEERYRDLDYIIRTKTPGEREQTYRLESNGDIGIQDAQTSLKKRIARRIFTDPGAFAWAPDYGVGVRVKSLARSGRIQELSNVIAEQVQREPDVLMAGVEVSLDRNTSGAFLNVTVRVRRNDARDQKILFSEPL
jgi:hypothetical protein